MAVPPRPNAWAKRLVIDGQSNAQHGRDAESGSSRTNKQPDDPCPQTVSTPQPKRASRGKPSPVVFNLLDSLIATSSRRADPPPRAPPKPTPPKPRVASRAAKPKRPTAMKRAVLQRRQQVHRSTF